MADNRDPYKPRGLLPCAPTHPDDPNYVKLERLPQNVIRGGRFKMRPVPRPNNALAPASALASTLASRVPALASALAPAPAPASTEVPTLPPLTAPRAPVLPPPRAPALPPLTSTRAPALVSSLAPALAPAPEGQASRRLLPMRALPILDPDDPASRFQLMYDVYLNSSVKTPYTLDCTWLARRLESLRMAARSRLYEAVKQKTNRLINNLQATKILQGVKRNKAGRIPYANMIDFRGEELITEIQQVLTLKFDRLRLHGMSIGEPVLDKVDLEYILQIMYTNATRRSTSSLIKWCYKFSKNVDRIRFCSEYSKRDIKAFDNIIQILLENCSMLLAQLAEAAAKATRRRIERNFFVPADEQDGGADTPPVAMKKIPRGDADTVDGNEEEAKIPDNTLQPAQVEEAKQDNTASAPSENIEGIGQGITASAPPTENIEEIGQGIIASASRSENIEEIGQGIGITASAPPSENIEEIDQDITAQQPQQVEEVDQDIAEPASGNVLQVNHDISSLPSENAVFNGDFTTPPAETADEAKQEITEV